MANKRERFSIIINASKNCPNEGETEQTYIRLMPDVTEGKVDSIHSRCQII